MAKIGRGRPSLGDKAKRQPLNMRTDNVMRARIEEAAELSGLSLSQEVERRLITSFIQDDFLGGPATAPFARMMIGAIAEIERAKGQSWRDDLPTWWAVKEALTALVRWYRPAADPEMQDRFVSLMEASSLAQAAADEAGRTVKAFSDEMHDKYGGGAAFDRLNGVPPLLGMSGEESQHYHRIFNDWFAKAAQATAAAEAYRTATEPWVEMHKEAKELGEAFAERVFQTAPPKA